MKNIIYLISFSVGKIAGIKKGGDSSFKLFDINFNQNYIEKRIFFWFEK